MSKTVVIVGMHRSGTSIVSKLIFEMGYAFGDDLLVADASNPDGHFEDNVLMKLNENLFYSCKGSWDAPPSKKRIEQNWALFEDEISQRINSLKKNQQAIAIKDPRVSLLMDYYFHFFENCKVIYVKRCCEQVAKSINKRDGIGLAYSKRLCNYYNKEVKASIQKLECNHIIVEYEDLIHNTSSMVRKISSFIETSLSELQINEIAKSVKNKEQILVSKKKHNHLAQYMKVIYRPDLALRYAFRRLRRFYLRMLWKEG